MLTTIDNPYNPFTDYDKWLNWDQRHLYYTQELLARFYGNMSRGINEEEIENQIKNAMIAIATLDTNDIYTIIGPEEKTPISQEAFEKINRQFLEAK